MTNVTVSDVSLNRKRTINQQPAPPSGVGFSKCRMSDFELHSGLDRHPGLTLATHQPGQKMPCETAKGLVNAGFSPIGNPAVTEVEKILHFGRNFLHFGPSGCILHSGIRPKVSRIIGLAKNQKCSRQNAIHVCILSQPAPDKAYSQNAECRKIPNYVRGRRTRLRGPSTTELRRCCRPVPGGLS